jgi:hypothetical protein
MFISRTKSIECESNSPVLSAPSMHPTVLKPSPVQDMMLDAASDCETGASIRTVAGTTTECNMTQVWSKTEALRAANCWGFRRDRRGFVHFSVTIQTAVSNNDALGTTCLAGSTRSGPFSPTCIFTTLLHIFTTGIRGFQELNRQGHSILAWPPPS